MLLLCHLLQQLPRPVVGHPRPAVRLAEQAADLLMAQVAEGSQGENLPHRLRQPVNEAVGRHHAVAVCQRVSNVAARVVDGLVNGQQFFLAHSVVQLPLGDGTQPGRYAGLPAEIPPVLESLVEGLLGEFLCQMGIAAQPQEERMDHLLIFAVGLFKIRHERPSFRILQARFHQLDTGVRKTLQ